MHEDIFTAHPVLKIHLHVYELSIHLRSRNLSMNTFDSTELPKPPEQLGVSDVQARSVVIQFFPGFDGKTSITNWVVEAQEGGSENWQEIYRVSAPDATSITVYNLTPFTQYKMRIIAVNIVGPSMPSEPTRQFQTSQDSPNFPPGEVTLRAVNSTALRISWAVCICQSINGQAY